MHIKFYHLVLIFINLSLSTYLFGNKFGGDPEITLILAQNIFEFNPNQLSGSSTPLYVLILSFFHIILGNKYIFIMKLINIISVLYFCYFLNRIKENNYGIILLLLNVSFLFQAFYSMENIPFAIIAICIFHYHINNNKFLFTLLIFIILFFIRVESIFFILALFFYEKNYSNKIITLVTILFLLIFVRYNNLIFGFDLYHAGKLRKILSNENFFISFNKFIILILYIGPTLLFYLLVFKTCLIKRIELLVCIVFIPLVLYTFNYLPTTHITRYSSFIFVTLVYLITINKCETKFLNKKFNYFIAFVILPILITTYFLRSNYTGWDFRSKTNIFDTYNDFSNKKELSDFLYNSFRKTNSNLQDYKINILIDEVQLRGRLDSRFNIFSIDGLTDPDFISYIENKVFNIEKYIIDKEINIILIDDKSTYFNSFNMIKNNQFNKINLSTKYIMIPSKFNYNNLDTKIFYFETSPKN